MTTEVLEKSPSEGEQKPVKLLQEYCFWEEDDPRWAFMNPIQMGEGAHTDNIGRCYDINLTVDSFIFAFTGRRGAGKTTSMTDEAARAAVIYPKMRLLSNYPIEFDVMYLDHHVRQIRAEPLDLYKLLCFDKEYQNCLICIDEAPDIISHMASMTWKNRLLNIFTRQLRKNRNSLMLGAQEFGLIDKSMRWQVDIIVECEDQSRKGGWAVSTRGECILQRWLDNSGMWTGTSWKDQQDYNRAHNIFKEIGEKRKLYPRFLWSDKNNGGHRAVFDTYYQQDVWESLKKVDMHLDSYSVGDKKNAEDAEDETGMTPKMRVITAIRQLIDTGGQDTFVAQPDFWEAIGPIDNTAKHTLSEQMKKAGMNNDPDLPSDMKKGRVKWYGLKTFDMDAFLRGGEK